MTLCTFSNTSRSRFPKWQKMAQVILINISSPRSKIFCDIFLGTCQWSEHTCSWICSYYFKNNIILFTGRSFFDRFASHCSHFVKFYSKTEIFQIENDPISMEDWVFERDHYTRIQVMMKYFTSRKYIFVAESQVLTIEASNKVSFTVVVSFQFCTHLFM